MADVSSQVTGDREELQRTRAELVAHSPCPDCVPGRREGMCAEANRLYGAFLGAIHRIQRAAREAPTLTPIGNMNDLVERVR